MSEQATGSCATHPGVAGRPCARCGDYLCATCTQSFEGQDVCLSCLESVAVLAEPSARLGAYLFNQAVASVPACLGIAGAVLLWPEDGLLIGVALALLWLLAFLALNVVLLRRHAQTLGKRWFGVRILRRDGQRPGLARLVLLREIVPHAIGAVPVLGQLFALVDLAFMFGAERRTLHDALAGTIVVQVPPVRGL